MSLNVHHLSGNLVVGPLTVDSTNNEVTVGSGITLGNSGTITAGSFEGDGSLLQGISSDSGSWVNGTDVVYLATSTDKVGIGTTSPGEKLHVNGNLRIGSSSDNTVDDNSNRYISTAGQLIIKSNDSGVNNSYVNLILQSGKTNPGKIVIGGGDTDTYRDIEFYTSGSSTERMHIHHDGNVGIGTSTPQQKLEVHGNILLGENQVKSFIHGGNSVAVSSDADVLIVADANDTSGAIGSQAIIFGAGSAVDTDDRDFTYAQAYPNDVPRVEFMRITADSLSGEPGRLGFGTASPEEKIHFHANHEYIYQRFSTTAAGTTDKFDIACWNSTRSNGDHGVMFNNRANSDMRFITNGSEVMRLKTDGKVGIGTSSPDHKLHIYDNSSTSPVYLKVQSETYNRAGIILGEDSSDICIMEYDGTGAGAENYLAFYSAVTNWISKGDGLNFIPQNGRVGLGTVSPEEVLHIYRGSTDQIYLQKTTSGGGVGIRFSTIAGANANQNGYLRYYHTDTDSYGLGNSFKFTTDQDSETLALGGSLHIGVDGKDAGDAGNHRKNLFIQSTYNGNTSQNYGWWMGAQDQGLSSTDNDFYFSVVRNGSIKECGAIIDQNNSTMNFTGQHRTFVKDTPTNQLDDKDGLIVSADQNEFVKMSGGVAYGNDAITINESLPLVSLSTKAKDKKCFGVLSTTEDPETRKEVHGNFASNMRKEEGDTRVYVNSVGEGAIWVTNINGALESGDYITTSSVAGYGMKQDDDILHNYTVAKILMDCDFNPPTQVKRVIKKEPKMVDYWVRYGDVKIKEEEYNTLPDSRRKIIEGVHHRIDQMDVRTEDPEKACFVYEQREDMVNVLDEHNEFQWEDTDETEKAYRVRYLLPDGTQISEEEYTTRALADEKVYVAAFVGCTYHCG